MVCRPACRGWCRPFKAEFCEIKFFNECIDGPHRIVFGDPVLQSFGEQTDCDRLPLR